MKQVFPPFGTLIEVKKTRECSTITSAGFVQSGPPTCISKISTGSDPPLPLNADVILEPKTVSLPSIWVLKNTMLASEVRPPPSPPPPLLADVICERSQIVVSEMASKTSKMHN